MKLMFFTLRRAVCPIFVDKFVTNILKHIFVLFCRNWRCNRTLKKRGVGKVADLTFIQFMIPKMEIKLWLDKWNDIFFGFSALNLKNWAISTFLNWEDAKRCQLLVPSINLVETCQVFVASWGVGVLPWHFEFVSLFHHGLLLDCTDTGGSVSAALGKKFCKKPFN